MQHEISLIQSRNMGIFQHINEFCSGHPGAVADSAAQLGGRRPELGYPAGQGGYIEERSTGLYLLCSPYHKAARSCNKVSLLTCYLSGSFGEYGISMRFFGKRRCENLLPCNLPRLWILDSVQTVNMAMFFYAKWLYIIL